MASEEERHILKSINTPTKNYRGDEYSEYQLKRVRNIRKNALLRDNLGFGKGGQGKGKAKPKAKAVRKRSITKHQRQRHHSKRQLESHLEKHVSINGVDGTITGSDAVGGTFKVRYNTGDEEDVNVEKVLSALNMYDVDKKEEVSYLLLIMFDMIILLC